MQKILYYDCFAGISGDMNLAAMLALGMNKELLRTELSKLSLDDQFQLDIEPAQQYGINGIRCRVHTKEQHHHRTLHDIIAIIENSTLDIAIQTTAIAIFTRIAEAESAVHGTPPDQVHFHEIGAIDSIVDIVGAAICRYHLGISQHIGAVWASPVELGGGVVRCEHGVMPVPAPATILLSHGIPTKQGSITAEATTPTGMAILAEYVDAFPSAPAMTITATGYGIGHRDNGKEAIPNVLRIHCAEVDERPSRPACLLQCNIDDMTGEALGFVMEKMLAEGAMDCHFTPIQMKKGRPATSISLLCAQADEARFMKLLFHHTSTLGIKSFQLQKTELARQYRTAVTQFGDITLKDTLYNEKVIRSKPEFEECRKLALKYNVPLAQIYNEVDKS